MYSLLAGTNPPSPCTGSMMMAATDSGATRVFRAPDPGSGTTSFTSADASR